MTMGFKVDERAHARSTDKLRISKDLKQASQTKLIDKNNRRSSSTRIAIDIRAPATPEVVMTTAPGSNPSFGSIAMPTLFRMLARAPSSRSSSINQICRDVTSPAPALALRCRSTGPLIESLPIASPSCVGVPFLFPLCWLAKPVLLKRVQ